jgi:hypothetical protein
MPVAFTVWGLPDRSKTDYSCLLLRAEIKIFCRYLWPSLSYSPTPMVRSISHTWERLLPSCFASFRSLFFKSVCTETLRAHLFSFE